jgi:molecular chaperone GrpE
MTPKGSNPGKRRLKDDPRNSPQKSEKKADKEKAAAAQGAEAAAQGAETEASKAASAGSSEKKNTAVELEEQVLSLTDRLQRKTAEFDNYQKRAQKERDETRKYATKPLALDLLGVLDSFERALGAAGDADSDASEFLAGFQMIREQFLNVLSTHAIVPIEALHEPFDPNIHDAVMEEEDPDFPDRTVIDELVKGFMLHDRLLRAAQVRVSRQPAEEKADEPAGNETAEMAPEKTPQKTEEETPSEEPEENAE